MSGIRQPAEPGAAPDRFRITVSRDIKLLRLPRQVNLVVGRPRLSLLGNAVITGFAMSSKNELASRLEQTGSIICWTVSNVPSDRLMEPPPPGKHPNSYKGFKTYFGEWPALPQLFHLTFYEEIYAVPTMEHWLGGPHPFVDLIFPDPELEERLRRDEVRLNLMRDIPEELWRVEKVETGLGTVSAEFVVTKAIQKSRP